MEKLASRRSWSRHIFFVALGLLAGALSWDFKDKNKIFLRLDGTIELLSSPILISIFKEVSPLLRSLSLLPLQILFPWARGRALGVPNHGFMRTSMHPSIQHAIPTFMPSTYCLL
mmetsp:Transcript_1869/g.5837  ORF Transcript_1869/g.5837 Transcript_1869/m.5837 type:complete len:115 (+) Transcript_1869:74-418(+)